MIVDQSVIKSCGGGEISDDLPPSPYLKTVLVVAALLVDSDDRILIAQRPAGKPMRGFGNFLGEKWMKGKRLNTLLSVN